MLPVGYVAQLWYSSNDIIVMELIEPGHGLIRQSSQACR